jgi:hypothetical protein
MAHALSASDRSYLRSPDEAARFISFNHQNLTTMASHFLLMARFALVVLIAGCYTSPVPIAPLNEAPPVTGLKGEWITPAAYLDEGDSPMRLRIETTDDVLFSIVATSTNPQDLDTLRFEAYATRLDESLFGNLKILSEEEEGFLIVRVTFPETGSMRVALVSDDLMTTEPATSEALRDFLVTNSGNPALFEEGDMYFVRLE